MIILKHKFKFFIIICMLSVNNNNTTSPDTYIYITIQSLLKIRWVIYFSLNQKAEHHILGLGLKFKANNIWTSSTLIVYALCAV